MRSQGSPTIPSASFGERLFIKKNITFHPKHLNRRIVSSSGHQRTFNPAVITNKELHMAHGNIIKDDEDVKILRLMMFYLHILKEPPTKKMCETINSTSEVSSNPTTT